MMDSSAPSYIWMEVADAIRLNGLDTPEIKGQCDEEKVLAREARDFARTLLSEAKEVRLVQASRGDKYFLVLGRLVADGKDLSQSLLDAHLAIAYNGGKKTAQWCPVVSN